MLSFISLLIVISVIVFVHEMGHFAAARWAGARVDIFSIGFGKAVLKWRDKKGTEWRIGLLPFGGFVSIYGQDDMFDRKKYSGLSAKDKKGHYLSLAPWKQAVVIFAGVFMNFVTAFVIYTGLFVGTEKMYLPVVGESANKSLLAGDRIIRINDKKIESWDQMILNKELATGATADVTVLRGEKIIQIKLPKGTWGIKSDVSRTEIIHRNVFVAMGRAGQELWNQSRMMLAMLGQMISGERSSKQLGGLLSIAEMGGQALAAGWFALLGLLALLSVNLAVINLFPLPVLDGGYLLILGIEAITGRKMQGKWIDWVMKIGWWFLIALMIFALSNDIVRLVSSH